MIIEIGEKYNELKDLCNHKPGLIKFNHNGNSTSFEEYGYAEYNYADCEICKYGLTILHYENKCVVCSITVNELNNDPKFYAIINASNIELYGNRSSNYIFKKLTNINLNTIRDKINKILLLK